MTLVEANLLTEDIPEKFKDPETGALNADNLLRSYKELEKRMSQQPVAPKTPEEYNVDVSHGMFEADPDVNQRLHKFGCTQDQVQEMYNIAQEKFVPMVQAMASDFEADREVEKLINHFGGVDQWKEVSRQLLAFGQQNLPEDVLENLSSSYEGVLALYRMMKSGEPGIQKQAASAMGSMDEKELQSMMRDPKYWREKDPAFVAKVTEGFENMYKK